MLRNLFALLLFSGSFVLLAGCGGEAGNTVTDVSNIEQPLSDDEMSGIYPEEE